MDNANSLTLTQNIEKQVEEISKNLGVPHADRTVLKISATEDPNKKTLTLLSGSWESDKPWFVVDEANRVHALTSSESFMHLVRSMQFATNENFGLKLEKAIWSYFPIDFQDVWAVATSELKKLLDKNGSGKIVEVDIEKLIGVIHKKHPNLFYHIREEHLLRGEEGGYEENGGLTPHN